MSEGDPTAGGDGVDAGTETGTESGTEADDSIEIDGTESAETPVEVGDDRRKHVEVLSRSGERTEHVESYLRHTTDEFVVSADVSFPPAETTRYVKSDLLRVEIAQHHSACFITTAVAGKGETLDALRGFRDDVLRSTPVGRALVGVYYRVSPPVARTLSRYPAARTSRLVRRLAVRSAALARRRNGASEPYRSMLALVLTFVYAVGVCCALAGHACIRLRESATHIASAGTDIETETETDA